MWLDRFCLGRFGSLVRLMPWLRGWSRDLFQNLLNRIQTRPNRRQVSRPHGPTSRVTNHNSKRKYGKRPSPIKPRVHLFEIVEHPFSTQKFTFPVSIQNFPNPLKRIKFIVA